MKVEWKKTKHRKTQHNSSGTRQKWKWKKTKQKFEPMRPKNKTKTDMKEKLKTRVNPRRYKTQGVVLAIKNYCLLL